MLFALMGIDTVPTEGELSELVDEFSDGKIQFAYVRVKDSNSTLPKNVLIAWVCDSSSVYIRYCADMSAVWRRRA